MARLRLSLLCVALAALALPWSAHAARPSHLHALKPAQDSGGRIAFTRNNNVYLMNADGSGQRALTTDGSADPNGISYRYSWSHDGRYLLLARDRTNTTDLLLLDRDGALLRRLATGLPVGYPSWAWAIDGDQVAYFAASRQVSPPGAPLRYHITIKRGDVHGAAAFLWSFDEPLPCGAGGGSPSPSMILYGQETGSGTFTLGPTFQWSIGQHLAIYSINCLNSQLDITDVRANKTFGLTPSTQNWGEAALNPTAPVVALVYAYVVHNAAATRLVVFDLRRGVVLWRVDSAEQPVWSRDGRVLYFEERKAGEVLPLQDDLGNSVDGTTFRSAIFSAAADGSHLTQLIPWQDAYGFGPLQLGPDGRSLVFSRVDNIWNLWRHRQAGNRMTDALVKRYGPHVRIQRLDGGKLVTIARDASRPAL